jgi:hypothetical protein
LVLPLAFAACGGEVESETPAVQDSAAAKPRWTVDLNRVRDGVFRPLAPRCLDKVRPGQTVEFRNFLPSAPANVTGIAGPAPMYSPNLVRPYNFVAADDPDNDLCDAEAADGACATRPTWSAWRFTFTEPGVYDWIDTNQGEPGRKVVDAYYGTVTFVGTDPDAPTGTICVQRPDGTGCEGVCCASDADCKGGTKCLRSEVDVVGQCRTPSG